MAVDRKKFVRCGCCRRIYALATAQLGDQLTLRCACNSPKFYSDDGSAAPTGTTVSILVVPAGWEPEHELYECSSCHGVFARTCSDDVAEAEFAIEFHDSTKPKVLVCDECYKAMMKAFRPTLLHMQ